MSDLVGNSEDRFSQNEAQMLIVSCLEMNEVSGQQRPYESFTVTFWQKSVYGFLRF